jgi:Flp pilus assembly pilin Flp
MRADMTNLNLLFMRLHAGLRTSVSRQEGQALIEYALIVSLIALVAIVALQTTGTNISKILNTIAGEI